MAQKHRRYTDEERAMFVAMLTAKGYPDTLGALKAVATYAQVHENVLRRWWKRTSNPPPTELVSQKKIELADMFEDVARRYLEHATDEDVVAGTFGKDAVIAAATATDKMRLLRGLPTEIVALIPGVVQAIQDMGQSPADVFNRIIQRAKQHTHT